MQYINMHNICIERLIEQNYLQAKLRREKIEQKDSLKHKNEIDLKQSFDDETYGFAPPVVTEEEFNNETVADNLDGFGLQDEEGTAIVTEEEYAPEAYADDEE